MHRFCEHGMAFCLRFAVEHFCWAYRCTDILMKEFLLSLIEHQALEYILPPRDTNRASNIEKVPLPGKAVMRSVSMSVSLSNDEAVNA